MINKNTIRSVFLAIIVGFLSSCFSIAMETSDTLATTNALFGKRFINLNPIESHSNAYGFHGDGFIYTIYSIPSEYKEEIQNNITNNKNNLPNHCYLWNSKNFNITNWKNGPITEEDLSKILPSSDGNTYMYTEYNKTISSDFYYAVIKRNESISGYVFIIDSDFEYLFSFSEFY